MATTDTVGQRIKRARLAKDNMKQEELATILGVDQGTVSMWENGKTEPSFEKLGKIAVALGVSPAELVDDPAPARPLVVPVVFVPVVKALAPQDGSLRDPANISDYAPFPQKGNMEVIGFVLPRECGGYDAGSTIFISPRSSYGPNEKVVYFPKGQEQSEAVICRFAEVPADLRPAVVGAVVGYYRSVG